MRWVESVGSCPCRLSGCDLVSLKASATVGPVACRGCSVKVIPCAAVPADACVVDASYMGAPTVSIEKLDTSQAQAAAHAVLKVIQLFSQMLSEHLHIQGSCWTIL